jgi:hypothetical protein
MRPQVMNYMEYEPVCLRSVILGSHSSPGVGSAFLLWFILHYGVTAPVLA